MKPLCSIFVSFALCACVTPYQDVGLTGGTSAVMITPDTAQISIKANSYTDYATAYRYALLKAAETTLEQGYGHFQVVSDEQYSTASSPAALGGPVEIEGFTPKAVDAIIRMRRGPKPGNAPNSYHDARAIVTTLGPQVGR